VLATLNIRSNLREESGADGLSDPHNDAELSQEAEVIELRTILGDPAILVEAYDTDHIDLNGIPVGRNYTVGTRPFAVKGSLDRFDRRRAVAFQEGYRRHQAGP